MYRAFFRLFTKDADVQVDGRAGAGKVRLIGAKAAKKMLLNKSFK